MKTDTDILEHFSNDIVPYSGLRYIPAKLAIPFVTFCDQHDWVVIAMDGILFPKNGETPVGEFDAYSDLIPINQPWESYKQVCNQGATKLIQDLFLERDDLDQLHLAFWINNAEDFEVANKSQREI